MYVCMYVCEYIHTYDTMYGMVRRGNAIVWSMHIYIHACIRRERLFCCSTYNVPILNEIGFL